jgi:hypothetical protein
MVVNKSTYRAQITLTSYTGPGTMFEAGMQNLPKPILRWEEGLCAPVAHEFPPKLWHHAGFLVSPLRNQLVTNLALR